MKTRTGLNQSVSQNLRVVFQALLGLIGFFSLLCDVARAQAIEPRIQLEVAVDPRLPPLTHHDWAKALSEVGVENLRVRTAYPNDTPNIQEIPSESVPTYQVLGVVNAQNELLLPDARFTIRQIDRLKQWINDLRHQGPPQSRPKQVAFGLNIVQFEQVRQDMSRPVEVSTKSRPRAELVETLVSSLSYPTVFDPQARQRLGRDLWEEELQGLTTGTALAYILRYDGLALVPQSTVNGIRYQIVIGHPKLTTWPVGWAPEESEAKVVPKLLETLTVNIQDVPVKDVLQSVTQRLSLMYLLDHPALARFGIEIDKTLVKIPQTKTTYSQIIKRSLFQGRLKGEIRCDEAGKPFLWITTLKPIDET